MEQYMGTLFCSIALFVSSFATTGLFLFVCLFVCLFRDTRVAYGGSQAKGQIGAAAASHSHSHATSKPCLRPTLQLTVTLDT